jgi:K+-sensing histidine kinase KdpD
LLVVLISGLTITYIFLRNQRIAKEEKENLDLLVNHKTLELQFTVAELLRAQKTLKEENNFKNQLYAILMHDIKSPLMFLAESSFMIFNKHKEKENDLTNIVRIAANTSQELHDFISDFLNWLGTQFIDYKVEIHELNVKTVIFDLVKFYQPIANAKNILIQTNQASNDILINSNITILQTILRNFIDNAIKYTPKGEINIATIEESEMVKIIITDTGKGLPTEIVKLIKDWENQKLTESMIGHSTTHKMGIKITLEFIKLIEGEISYTEMNQGGSSIQISLKKDIKLK